MSFDIEGNVAGAETNGLIKNRAFEQKPALLCQQTPELGKIAGAYAKVHVAHGSIFEVRIKEAGGEDSFDGHDADTSVLEGGENVVQGALGDHVVGGLGGRVVGVGHGGGKLWFGCVTKWFHDKRCVYYGPEMVP